MLIEVILVFILAVIGLEALLAYKAVGKRQWLWYAWTTHACFFGILSIL